jgi:hypothetical protein
VGLKPIRRWVWARRGQRVVATVQPRYQWTYLYGFVRPNSGQTWWLLLPTVRADLFSLALAEFAQAVGAGQGKQVLLLLDRAGWHLSSQVQIPAGVHLVWLPPYSPELQPAERLWPLADEPLVTRASRRSMPWKPCLLSAAPPCNTNPPASKPSRASIGGQKPPDWRKPWLFTQIWYETCSHFMPRTATRFQCGLDGTFKQRAADGRTSGCFAWRSARE